MMMVRLTSQAHDRSRHRRGSVVVVVLWAISLAAIIVSSVQLLGYRQAAFGTEALARTQARWAARGGVEYTIAVLKSHTEDPVPDDAFALVRDMEHVFYRKLANAAYDIRYDADRQPWKGPMDEHSKLNINTTLDQPELLIRLDDMTPDVVDAIVDWIDEDDDPRALGVERDYYLSLATPYEPRNGLMRSIHELGLVAGVWPKYLREEDWNLNNRLDTNEDDDDQTWPNDNPDHEMETGWAGSLTAYSVQSSLADSGEPRIVLGSADPIELADRLDFEEDLANELIGFGQDPNRHLAELLVAYMARNFSDEPGGADNSVPELDEDQLRLVLAETMIGDPAERKPGLLNVNSVSADLLRQLFFGSEYLADEILFLRDARSAGITSLVDLAEIPAFQENVGALDWIARNMTTTSHVFSISCQGHSDSGGVEVEMIVVVDRSSLPIRILEYREQ